MSTVLIAIYFMKTVIRIYTPTDKKYEVTAFGYKVSYAITLGCFILLNLLLGLFSQPITNWITQGLTILQ